jgi:hypothetical protein
MDRWSKAVKSMRLGDGIASLIALSLNWGPSKQGGPEVEDPKTIKYHRVTQHETCIWTTVCREPPELKPTHTRSIVEIPMATCLEVPAPASSWDMAIYKISNAINFGCRCSIGGDSLQKKLLGYDIIPRIYFDGASHFCISALTVVSMKMSPPTALDKRQDKKKCSNIETYTHHYSTSSDHHHGI